MKARLFDKAASDVKDTQTAMHIPSPFNKFDIDPDPTVLYNKKTQTCLTTDTPVCPSSEEEDKREDSDLDNEFFSVSESVSQIG